MNIIIYSVWEKEPFENSPFSSAPPSDGLQILFYEPFSSNPVQWENLGGLFVQYNEENNYSGHFLMKL